MSEINKASKEIREMDEMAEMNSAIHSINPLSKLVVTIAYIFITVSFDKYQLSAISAMILYPALLFAISGISVKKCFYKMRFVLPLVLAVGIFNPFFDKSVAFTLGNITVTGGVISMITLMQKGIFCLSASFLLASTTSIDKICAALRMLHFPKFFVSLLLLTYRYIEVMVDEVSNMTTAYKLRAPGQKGIKFSAWGSFLGQLLLRSMDKAEEIYAGMMLRGYDGEFRYARKEKFRLVDAIYCVVWIALFVLFRFVDVAGIVGNVIALGGNLVR